MKEPIRKLSGHRPQQPAKPVRHVVAALILREGEAGREVLVCQRRPDQPMSLKWEFPGGKVEPGETAEAALARELNEELGIEASVGHRITTVFSGDGVHRQPGKPYFSGHAVEFPGAAAGF